MPESTISKDLQSKLGRWRLVVGQEVFADFSMGCFYDDAAKRWKVYINYERGRHRIRLSTEDEEEAFEEICERRDAFVGEWAN